MDNIQRPIRYLKPKIFLKNEILDKQQTGTIKLQRQNN